ncbi:MAG: hypothetical protein AAGK00_15055 [Pseudomonadota bacterium]
MVARRITSTFSADFIPLGTPGQRSFDLITREAAEISTAHRALYAEPFISPQGDSIDWYAALPGNAVPLTSLDATAADDVRVRLDQLVGDIQARAVSLRAETDPQRRRLGEALANSVSYPGDESVFIIGNQPVIVCWAHQSSQGAAPTSALTQAAPRRALPPNPAPVAPAVAAAPAAPVEQVIVTQTVTQDRTPLGWLWWLLWGAVGVTVIAIALILLPACGLSFLPGLDHCEGRPVVSEAAQVAERRAELEAEVTRLERQLEQLDLACLPTPQPPAPEPVEETRPPPAPEPATPEPPAEEERAEPEPQPDPPPPPQPQPEDEEIDRRVTQQGGETDGELRITLAWNNLSDLDLRVITPSGCEIHFRNRNACGGVLDIDQNAGSTQIPTPVENVVFTGTPQRGRYIVVVRNFKQRGFGGSAFKLRIHKGAQVERYDGFLRQEKQTASFRFSYP